MTETGLRKVSFGLTLVGILITGISIFWGSKSFIQLFHYFSLWSYSPFIGLGISAWVLKSRFYLKLWIGMLVAVLGSSVYGYTMNFLNPDAQGALIYLFLPVWQWVGIAFVIFIGFIVKLVFKN